MIIEWVDVLIGKSANEEKKIYVPCIFTIFLG